MTRLQEVLQYLENNLDIDHIERAKSRLKAVINYQETDRPVLQLPFPCERFEMYPYSEAFYDMEKMMINGLLGEMGGSVCNSVEIKDDTVPMLRANYNTGIIPSLFGLNTCFTDGNPWVEQLDSLDRIRELVDKGIPNIRFGLAARAFETQEYFNEQLSKYPKCKQAIPVYHANPQGSFDNAQLMWGSDIYCALYDELGLVHSLLKLITETIICFMKEINKNIIHTEDEYVYQWNTLFKGGVLIRDDSAVNISREMYEEFVKPYDEMIFKALGSGSIHFCGRGDQWIFDMMNCEGLGSINFGQPPNMEFGLEFLNKIYPAAKDKKDSIIQYGISSDLIKDIMGSELKTGVTYYVFVSNKQEALELLSEIGAVKS